MIRVYLKIPENLIRLIVLDGFLFVYIPFDIMVKFIFLARFSEDHLSNKSFPASSLCDKMLLIGD